MTRLSLWHKHHIWWKLPVWLPHSSWTILLKWVTIPFVRPIILLPPSVETELSFWKGACISLSFRKTNLANSSPVDPKQTLKNSGNWVIYSSKMNLTMQDMTCSCPNRAVSKAIEKKRHWWNDWSTTCLIPSSLFVDSRRQDKYPEWTWFEIFTFEGDMKTKIALMILFKEPIWFFVNESFTKTLLNIDDTIFPLYVSLKSSLSEPSGSSAWKTVRERYQNGVGSKHWRAEQSCSKHSQIVSTENVGSPFSAPPSSPTFRLAGWRSTMGVGFVKWVVVWWSVGVHRFWQACSMLWIGGRRSLWKRRPVSKKKSTSVCISST